MRMRGASAVPFPPGGSEHLLPPEPLGVSLAGSCRSTQEVFGAALEETP